MAAPGYQETPIFVEDEAFFESLLREPQKLRAFRANPTKKAAGQLLRVLAKTEDTWTKPIENNAEALHAGARELFDSEGTFVGNGTVLRIRDERVQGGTPSYRYVMVTAGHVAEHAVLPEGALQRKWKIHSNGADVAVCEIREDAVAVRGGKKDALHLGTTQTRAARDISGLYGICLGRDTDHGPLERKVYPSRISPRLTRRFSEVLEQDVTDTWQTEEHRIVVLHPDQIRIIDGKYAAQGMSGSAYLYFDAGQKGVEFGGIFIAVAAVDIPEKDERGRVRMTRYITGDIADHVLVREAIRELFSER